MALPTPASLWMPVRCHWCRGTGQHRHAAAYCAVCLATWSAEDAAAYLDRQWGGWYGYALLGDWLWQHFAKLPCGHPMRDLRYADPTCVACRGTGTRWHHLTAAEVTSMFHWSGSWGRVSDRADRHEHMAQSTNDDVTPPTLRTNRNPQDVRPIRPLTPRLRAGEP